MQTKIILVTPNLAAQWLETNSNNRPLSKPYVEELARYLLNGTFQTTHQGIAFDNQDRLRDGQHRLTAIVQTGIAVRLLVATGLTWCINHPEEAKADGLGVDEVQKLFMKLT